MKNFIFHLFILLILICQYSKVNGQVPLKEQAKNTIYASAGVVTIYGVASVNYERLLFSKDQKYKGNYYMKASFGSVGNTFGALTLQRVIGKRKHHLEMGLGLLLLLPTGYTWGKKSI